MSKTIELDIPTDAAERVRQHDEWKAQQVAGREQRIVELEMALREAERFMTYFAGETDNTFIGSGTPQTCLAVIRKALGTD